MKRIMDGNKNKRITAYNLFQRNTSVSINYYLCLILFSSMASYFVVKKIKKYFNEQIEVLRLKNSSITYTRENLFLVVYIWKKNQRNMTMNDNELALIYCTSLILGCAIILFNRNRKKRQSRKIWMKNVIIINYRFIVT